MAARRGAARDGPPRDPRVHVTPAAPVRATHAWRTALEHMGAVPPGDALRRLSRALNHLAVEVTPGGAAASVQSPERDAGGSLRPRMHNTLHDASPVSLKDLSGQFFINQEQDFDVGGKASMTRAQACLSRLQQLNLYVRCKQAPDLPIPAS